MREVTKQFLSYRTLLYLESHGCQIWHLFQIHLFVCVLIQFLHLKNSTGSTQTPLFFSQAPPTLLLGKLFELVLTLSFSLWSLPVILVAEPSCTTFFFSCPPLSFPLSFSSRRCYQTHFCLRIRAGQIAFILPTLLGHTSPVTGFNIATPQCLSHCADSWLSPASLGCLALTT